MSTTYEFGAPQKVTVGTIGPAGQRVFFIQALEDERVVTVKLEKRQVEALARHLGELLQDLPRPGHLPEGEELALSPFIDAAFVVGSLGVAYDAASDRLLVVAEARVGDDEEGDPDELRIAMTREQAGALAIRGMSLVESGRPPCPLCGFPLDPRGHACPRTNGHHAPLT